MSARASIFSIKCSICNADVEISQLPDHVCSSPKSEELDLGRFPLQKSPPLKAGPNLPKPTTLPPIDPLAANKPFLGPGQLTPSSSTSGSWTHSPSTPRDGQPLRTPAQNIPPSPNPLGRGLDGRDTKANSSASIGSENQLVPLRSPGLSPASPGPSPTTNDFYAPISPTVNSSKNVAARMNNIAPGPFALNNSKDRPAEVLPTLAASFPGKSQPQPIKKQEVEPLPALATGYPGEEDRRSQHRREPTDGSIKFGFEHAKRMLGGSGRETQENVVKGYQKQQYKALSQDAGSVKDRETQKPPPTAGSGKFDLSERSKKSQSSGSESSRPVRRERDLPGVPPLAYGSQEGQKARPAEQSEQKSPYGHRSMNSENPPFFLKLETLKPENRSRTFDERSPGKPSGGRLPPHPGMGLPRSPAQTVKQHLEKKASLSLAKELPTPPKASSTPPTVPTAPTAPTVATTPTAATLPKMPFGRRPSQTCQSSPTLGGDIARGTTGRARNPSPARFRPPLEKLQPPLEKLPPTRQGTPPTASAYSDFSLGNPYASETPTHSTTPSVSSKASSIFSDNSMRSGSSVSSASLSVSDDSQVSKSQEPKVGRTRRNPSKGSRGINEIDDLMKELQSSIHNLQPSPVKERHNDNDQRPSASRHERETSPGNRPPRSPPQQMPPQHQQRPQQRPHPRPQQGSQPAREERPKQLQQLPPNSKYMTGGADPYRRQPPSPYGAPTAYAAFKPAPNTSKLPPSPRLSPPPPQLPPPSPKRLEQEKQVPLKNESPVRRPAGSKGNCRGCGEAIVGKSISSADGRLTGRYHKACFVCQHCRLPFKSAEFYVLDNLPYCERHYHKLNHSLCPTCDRGIEGPCLETENRQRFHPGCFTCSECRCVLGDDYFELNGRQYCEQHAYRMIQGSREGLGPNRNMANMERRKTRMMFMGNAF